MNGYLLDTHALLWWLDDPKRLSATAQQVIADTDTRIYTSAIVGWEVGIKSALGKLNAPDTATLMQAIHDAGIMILKPTFEQGLSLRTLPRHHGDPFDRLMIAQARHENLTLITRDKKLKQYDLPILYA